METTALYSCRELGDALLAVLAGETRVEELPSRFTFTAVSGREAPRDA